jgi:hypothetical protein
MQRWCRSNLGIARFAVVGFFAAASLFGTMGGTRAAGSQSFYLNSFSRLKAAPAAIQQRGCLNGVVIHRRTLVKSTSLTCRFDGRRYPI